MPIHDEAVFGPPSGDATESTLPTGSSVHARGRAQVFRQEAAAVSRQIHAKVPERAPLINCQKMKSDCKLF